MGSVAKLRIFSEKPSGTFLALSDEHSCAKAKKSLEPFSGKVAD